MDTICSHAGFPGVNAATARAAGETISEAVAFLDHGRSGGAGVSACVDEWVTGELSAFRY